MWEVTYKSPALVSIGRGSVLCRQTDKGELAELVLCQQQAMKQHDKDIVRKEKTETVILRVRISEQLPGTSHCGLFDFFRIHSKVRGI